MLHTDILLILQFYFKCEILNPGILLEKEYFYTEVLLLK